MKKISREENIQATASYCFLHISRCIVNMSKSWDRKQILRMQFNEEKSKCKFKFAPKVYADGQLEFLVEKPSLCSGTVGKVS